MYSTLASSWTWVHNMDPDFITSSSCQLCRLTTGLFGHNFSLNRQMVGSDLPSGTISLEMTLSALSGVANLKSGITKR